MASKEKKGFKLPHQLVILFCITAAAMIATYIVSAGSIIHTIVHALASLFANSSIFVAANGM
ncbi:MAG: hypothetical protein HFF79_01635 [Oscillospiraceae bacterium]|nr:hypothetical protein [Oscillospiraceae bacterium]